VTRLVGTELGTAAAASLAADVRYYLMQSPRQLPSRALYDTLGSALFDAICHLPWYPVTRAERRLIDAHRSEIFDAAAHPDRLVELGCGNGDKLNLLLGPRDMRAPRLPRRIDLVDVSTSALASAARSVGEDRDLVVVTHEARYEDGLALVAASRERDERLCVLFLGSNIGNFDPPGAAEFISTIRRALAPGDALLIGTDLVKPERDLLLAYDDPLGITAAFNRNLLVRINRELGGSFALDGFSHRAVWNAAASRIEMHLVSERRQHVDIPAAGLSLDFEQDETIWTESSYKYDTDRVDAMLSAAAFSTSRRWVDGEGRFLLTVARAGK
jgi:L-histidine N-alpha-methyltransferase